MFSHAAILVETGSHWSPSTAKGLRSRAIKTVMKWTGVSERTAKNWIAGFHGPAGEHLIELLRNSDEVLAAVLSLSERSGLKIGAGLQETREILLQLLEVLDALLGDSGAEAGENE